MTPASFTLFNHEFIELFELTMQNDMIITHQMCNEFHECYRQQKVKSVASYS